MDDSTEIALETVKTRAVKGVVFLTGRTFILNVVSLAAMGFLTVFLEPADLGVFWVVTAVVNFLNYFSDIGLAASLVQKKETPTDSDLKTTFVVQQFLVILLLLILYLVSPLVVRFYHLNYAGTLLMYALGISLLFNSLKTIPSVLLERKLEFEKLVIPQVVENLIYNLVVVYFAWRGYGVASFTIAVLVRSMVGLTMIYILKPWRPGFAFSLSTLKTLFSFGVPYQVNTFLAAIKDDGMSVVLGGILGPQNFSYLGWAQKWGQAPLRFFMDHVIKVTFPAFSRMQHEHETLKRSLERSIYFICFLVFPTTVGLLILAPILVTIIPKYGKWTPALIPLMLISVNTIFAAVTTQLTNLLNSIGKIKTTFKLMVMWSVLTWLLVPGLAYLYGVNGAAVGYAIVGTSSIIAIIIARRYVAFSLGNSFTKPLFAAFIMGLVLLIIRSYLPANFVSVAILVLSGMFVYMLSMYLLMGNLIYVDIKKSFDTFFSRNG